MKKSWKKPNIIYLNDNRIKSGATPTGAERILTCSGNVTPAAGYSNIPLNSACTSQNPANPYNCNGVIAQTRLYLGGIYGDVTVAQANCS